MNDISFIQLHGRRGGFAIVDADLFPELNRFKWYLGGHGYVYRGDYIPETQETVRVYLHRVVHQTPPNTDTDHINGNKLDNTRANLRSASRSQNLANQRSKSPKKSSRFKGVAWCNTHKVWRAQIHCKADRLETGRRAITIGTFHTEEEAARAYNEKAVELFGEFAHLNLL